MNGELSVVITNLKPNTRYTIWVAAKNIQGESEHDSEQDIDATTLAPSKSIFDGILIIFFAVFMWLRLPSYSYVLPYRCRTGHATST